MASKSITFRLPEEVNERLERSVAKIGGTKSEWIVDAIEIALEREEQRPMPAAIARALPRRVGDRMIMPEGVVHTRDF